MLALIEKGDGNPTLGILWKIANGLGVPFDELTRRPDPMNHVVKISEIEPIPIADGTARNYSVFSDDKTAVFLFLPGNGQRLPLEFRTPFTGNY